jgi:hypothetical protein
MTLPVFSGSDVTYHRKVSRIQSLLSRRLPGPVLSALLLVSQINQTKGCRSSRIRKMLRKLRFPNSGIERGNRTNESGVDEGLYK